MMSPDRAFRDQTATDQTSSEHSAVDSGRMPAEAVPSAESRVASFTETDDIDLDRRFGGINRLYGEQAPSALAHAHVAVVGIGGVGSWAVEALARSGVGALTLIDMDHVSESNINRQLHALTGTLGQSKIAAMADRIAGINPQCRVTLCDDFVTVENVAERLCDRYDAILDCADQAPAKIAMILHAKQQGIPMVVCGGAGGKTDPLTLRAGDLSESLNDALLAKLRNILRRQHGFARGSDAAGKPRKRVPKMGVTALWFDQPAILPEQWAGGGLACAGYGSIVTVTAAMGMAAAHRALTLIVSPRRGSQASTREGSTREGSTRQATISQASTREGALDQGHVEPTA